MKLVKNINKEASNKPKVNDKEAEEAIKKILTWIGEDPTREGLLETPKRVVKAFKEYFKGYHQDAEEDLLDKAWGLEQNSRLSCQVIPANDDLEVEIPKYNINQVSEDH